MRIKNVLIERGKLGKDRSMIGLSGMVIQKKVPVYLQDEFNVDEPIVNQLEIFNNSIGDAEVFLTREGLLLANIEISSNKDYLKLYPSVIIGIKNSHNKGSIKVVNKSNLIGISLTPSPNCDPKIPTIGKKYVE